MTKPEHEYIAKLLKERYKLNDVQVTKVLEYAYCLSEQCDTDNDFALARELNERVVTIFDMMARNDMIPRIPRSDL